MEENHPEKQGLGWNEDSTCKECGLCPTEKSNDGYWIDPCLGKLPGVKNACCGHGGRVRAYVMFEGGLCLDDFAIDKSLMKYHGGDVVAQNEWHQIHEIVTEFSKDGEPNHELTDVLYGWHRERMASHVAQEDTASGALAQKGN